MKSGEYFSLPDPVKKSVAVASMSSTRARVLPLREWPAAVVVNAASLSAARTCLKRESFDLVVLDWQLGSEDGGSLLPDIRALQPGTPVVALTAMEHHPQMAEMDVAFVKTRVRLENVVGSCLDIVAHRHQTRGGVV